MDKDKDTPQHSSRQVAMMLLDLYNHLGTNPDKNSEHIEEKIKEYGFTVGCCEEKTYAMFLVERV